MTQPTYLVAVSNGSVYLGFSPTQLTQATDGGSVLDDTVDMDMQDGPGSPNDTGDRPFHRFMYFADGTRYKRLDAHTGAVIDWAAFNGTDAVSSETIAGALPFSAGQTDDITGADTGNKQFTVSGDQTAAYTDGAEAVVQSSTGNNGVYTVNGDSTYDAGADETTITVNETVADGTADGSISTVDGRCTLLALYRNRLVFAGLETEPGNWFMAAVGDPRNADYSPPTTSATQAVAGNLAEAGETPDDIRALIPFSDDLMVFGCENSLWRLTGDPAAGGYIDRISQGVGIAGPDAWAFDPNSTLYFMGTDGLYRVPRDASGLENMSRGLLDETFSDIDLTAGRVLLAWDNHRHGLNIFITRDDDTSPKSWWWDARTESLWPMSTPDDNGPVSVLQFNVDSEQDRSVLLGGKDGYIRRLLNLRPNDNNGVLSGESVEVAIDGHVDIGPIVISDPSRKERVNEMTFVLGENSHDVTLEVFSGSTAEEAARASTPRFKKDLNLGRNVRVRQRIADPALMLRLGNDTQDEVWSFETGVMYVRAAGKARGQ